MRISIFAFLLLVAAAPALLSACNARKYPTHDVLTPINVDGGSVEVTGVFNQCPSASFGVSPMTARIDQPFDLAATGSDPDDGGTVTFSWAAASGFLAISSAQMTTFHCSEAGPVTIVLTVSDGSCQTMVSASIYCLGSHQDGAAPDEGEPTGAGGMGGRTGAGGSTGGGGMRGSGGMSGTGGMVAGPTCPAAEPGQWGRRRLVETGQCTVDNCSLPPTEPNTDGCCGLASMADQVLVSGGRALLRGEFGHLHDRRRSDQLLLRQQATHLLLGDRGGGRSRAAQVIAAAKSSDPTVIKTKFISPTSPLGRATNLTTCRGSFCSAECGIK